MWYLLDTCILQHPIFLTSEFSTGPDLFGQSCTFRFQSLQFSDSSLL